MTKKGDKHMRPIKNCPTDPDRAKKKFGTTKPYISKYIHCNISYTWKNPFRRHVGATYQTQLWPPYYLPT